MSSESGSSNDLYTDSDGREEEDDGGDLSHLGATATSVKFQTVKEHSFQRTEIGSDGLTTHILESCEPSHQESFRTSLEQDNNVTSDLKLDHGTRVFQQNFIQVQQRFRDITVEGTRNLTIGGTQNISKTESSRDDPLSWREKLLARTISRVKEWTKGMVQTSALQDVMKKLNAGTSWITVKGSPGEGKTTLAYMALAELHKTGRQVFQVISPNEFSEVVRISSNPVIMLDDIFGNLEFDQSEWLRWKTVLHQVLDIMEHRSQDREMTSSKDVTVILVGRDYILNTASCDMGRISHFFTRKDHAVVMSNTQERAFEEKISILKAIAVSSGIDLDENTIDNICKSTCPHGFPHVCRLYLTICKREPSIRAEVFFKTPLEFLNQTIAKLMHNKFMLILFKEMIKGNGKVSVEDLGKLDNASDTILIGYDLLGTYLRKEDDYFLFDHPSIYDSVVYNLCNLYPLFVIENCNLSFIHERLRLQPSHQNQQNIQSIESDLIVNIPRSYCKHLAKRFANSIESGHLQQVLSHNAFTEELFIEEFMSQLSLPLNKVLHLRDKTSGGTFLSFVSSNKSPQLLEYIENQTNIWLTQEDIITVLYGVCKYAASDVLTYLTETRNMLNMDVRFEDKETPLMIAAETRDIQFVNQLMSLKPDLNAHDRLGKTVLNYLCENGLVEAVKQMLDSGTDLDLKYRLGLSPLYHACKGNHEQVVKLLLERGAEIDRDAIDEACYVGNIDIVRLLFERGDTVNVASGLATPLHSACEGGHLKIITFLIEKGAPVLAAGVLRRSPLHTACINNKPEAVKYLLGHGAIIDICDCGGNTSLYKASERGFNKTVDVLLMAGATVNVLNKDGHTPLHAAAENGSNECIKALLEAKADVNIQSNDGCTPLHAASGVGSKECVLLLLMVGAQVNVQANDGYTPLHKAAERGYNKNLQVLLNAGANVNAQSKHGSTPLHKAAESGSTESVGILLKAGSDVNITNEHGYTPLHAAANRGSSECVHMLVKAGANVNVVSKEGYTPLHKAAARRHTNCTCVLLNAGADANLQSKYGYTALYKAVESGSKECVSNLLQAGVDVNVHINEGFTQRHRAIERGSKECVDVLLKSGVYFNVQNRDGNTPLHEAVERKYTECLGVLLKAGANVNVQRKDGYTPLLKAADVNSMVCVDMLLNAGADANIQSKDGCTPLHKAAERKSKVCICMLLKVEARVNVQNKDGYTPLHEAVERGSEECVDMLLNAGADVNVESKDGYTPLHTAAIGRTKECMDILLRIGSELNAKSKYGHSTPLHKAAEMRSEECVKTLLKAGANSTVKRRDGYTPLHIAAEKGSKECVAALLNSGAHVNATSTDKQTPLHKAVCNSPYLTDLHLPDICVCQILIKHGADINKQDKDGNTPLHQLCRVNNDTIIGRDWPQQPASAYEGVYRTLVELLVEHGAKDNIHNKKGVLALHAWCQTLVRR